MIIGHCEVLQRPLTEWLQEGRGVSLVKGILDIVFGLKQRFLNMTKERVIALLGCGWAGWEEC